MILLFITVILTGVKNHCAPVVSWFSQFSDACGTISSHHAKPKCGSFSFGALQYFATVASLLQERGGRKWLVKFLFVIHVSLYT